MKPKPSEACVLCIVRSGSALDMTLRVYHQRDSRGNGYAMVLMPLCSEHENTPTIHQHTKVVKP